MTSQIETSALDMRWDLKPIYATVKDFQLELENAKKALDDFHSHLDKTLKEAIVALQKAGQTIKDLRAYVSCLLAENPQSVQAQEKNASVTGFVVL